MTSNLSTIFFDWSGVVADDTGDEFIRQLFRRVGASDDQAEEIVNTSFIDFLKGNVSETVFWDTLKETYGFDTVKLTMREFDDWHGLKANKDILALAKEAKSKGYRITILTNIIEPVYNIIKQAGITTCSTRP